MCTICVIINDCTYPGLKSLQKAVLHWGSQNERFIPNGCTLCCCFVQVFIKSPWAWGKVFTYSFIVHVQQTAISLRRTLSPIWAHTEVIKRMFSGTYNNRNNELYSKGKKSLKWEGKKVFLSDSECVKQELSHKLSRKLYKVNSKKKKKSVFYLYHSEKFYSDSAFEWNWKILTFRSLFSYKNTHTHTHL